MEYDVIIIGAGPAGISASLYTVRANKKTLVLYEDLSSLEKTHKIENYYGFENGIDGKGLYETGIKLNRMQNQVEKYEKYIKKIPKNIIDEIERKELEQQKEKHNKERWEVEL